MHPRVSQVVLTHSPGTKSSARGTTTPHGSFGVTLAVQPDGRVHAESVVPDTPAAMQLERGDVVESINGTSTARLTSADVDTVGGSPKVRELVWDSWCVVCSSLRAGMYGYGVCAGMCVCMMVWFSTENNVQL